MGDCSPEFSYCYLLLSCRCGHALKMQLQKALYQKTRAVSTAGGEYFLGLFLTIFEDTNDGMGEVGGFQGGEPAVVVDYFLNVKKALDFLSLDVRT